MRRNGRMKARENFRNRDHLKGTWLGSMTFSIRVSYLFSEGVCQATIIRGGITTTCARAAANAQISLLFP